MEVSQRQVRAKNGMRVKLLVPTGWYAVDSEYIEAGTIGTIYHHYDIKYSWDCWAVHWDNILSTKFMENGIIIVCMVSMGDYLPVWLECIDEVQDLEL